MAFINEVTTRDVYVALKSILNALMHPLWVNPTSGSIRLIDTVTTTATVTTVTQIGGIAAYDSMLIIPMRNNWANLIRTRIS